MPRVKGGPRPRRRHNAVLKQTKGQWGTRHRLYLRAHEALMHSLQYAFEHRRERKGDMRSIWIQRINAGARMNGTTYSRLIHGLQAAGITMDRKVLAEIAFSDPAAFSTIVEKAKAAVA